MAVFGDVTFVRVTAQTYTGEAVVPSKNDIFVETYDMSGFADGTIITVTQLDEYAAREMTIECSNNIEPGTATINVIDPSGQFSVSGTFEIISNVLVNIMGLKHFKEKIENDVDEKIANLVNSAPETLDTLGELAIAMQENEDVVTALNTAIGNKANQSDLNTTNTNITNLATRMTTAETNINNKANQSSLNTTNTNVTNLTTRVTELENNSGGSITIESYTPTFRFESSGSSFNSAAYKNGSVTLSEVTTQPRFISIRTSRLYTIMSYTYNKLDDNGLTVNFNYLTSTGGSATIYIDLIY